MDTIQLASLLVFLFPLAFSPGPGNLFFAANGARFGFAATFGTTAGYHTATFSVTLLVGFAIFTGLSAAPETFSAVKIAGSLYVYWLAWKLLRADRLDQPRATTAGFANGVILLALNPKAHVIITLMFSQFLAESSNGGEVVAIAAVFTANNLVAFTFWTLVGDRLAKTFRTEGHARYLNTMFGSMLAIVGTWMLVS